jgi:hypothetical protein
MSGEQGLGVAISSYASVIFVPDEDRKAWENRGADDGSTPGEATRLRMDAILVAVDSKIPDADFRCTYAHDVAYIYCVHMCTPAGCKIT